MRRSKEERAQGRLTDTYWIYSISNPLTGEVFYVGQTNNLRSRFHSHTLPRKQTEKDSIIKSMLENNNWPVFTILERTVGQKTAVEREGYHIARLRNEGHPLANSIGEMNYSKRFQK